MKKDTLMEKISKGIAQVSMNSKNINIELLVKKVGFKIKTIAEKGLALQSLMELIKLLFCISKIRKIHFLFYLILKILKNLIKKFKKLITRK